MQNMILEHGRWLGENVRLKKLKSTSRKQPQLHVQLEYKNGLDGMSHINSDNNSP